MMRKLQMTSKIVLLLGVGCILLWRFVLPVPDWVVRLTGAFLLISIFTMAFSSIRLHYKKEK